MSVVPQGGLEAAANAGGRRWSFATAEFDERSFELHVNGQLAELERKSLEVLRQLLYRAGEVVTKDELLEAVWPGRILSDNSLPKSISRIREVLGDDEQLVIKTVHGYGYRLVAPVKVQSSRAAPALTRLDLKAGDHPPLRPLWSLVERLGGGGQGEVWLVRHDKTHEPRVFKFALDLAGLAAIKREITLYRFLRESLEGRDEFTRVLDWNLEEAPYYIELEHGVGGNLESWAESVGGLDQVPLATRLELVAQIAEALAAAHSVGVLHKDLKPSNVLVISSPLPHEAGERSRAERAGEGQLRIKLTDFGSGGVLDPQRLEALGITRLGFTQSVLTGEAAATAMYLAPEVMIGQPATVQGDVYSLGILLYQMVIGDLKHPLAPGWEQRVDDPLLCEDISLAVAGEPTRRLADASALATRLRTLEARHQQREAEQAEKDRLEQEQRAAEVRARKAELAVERLRTRRTWMRTVLAMLIVGVSISLGLYLEARRARNEAAAAAATSQAVAEYLSKDLFAQVGTKPLRDFTVTELVESASESLNRRSKELPEVSAQLHAALGNAAFAVERWDLAKAQLGQALASFESSGSVGSEAGVLVAARLLSFKERISELPTLLPRYERILVEGQSRLGDTHPHVLTLRERIAEARFWAGDWKRAADELRDLIRDREAAGQPRQAVGAEEAYLGQMLVLLGDFAGAAEVTRSAIGRLQADPGSPPFALSIAYVYLALALANLEQFAAAREQISSAERLLQPWVINDDSMLLISARAASALVELREGRWPAAASILERTIRQVEQSDWNKSSDITAEYRWQLAEAYAGGGRRADALAEMQRALEIAEKSFGPHHPTTQHIRIGLADLLRTSNGTEALRILAGVDAQVIAGLGPDHPYSADRDRVEGLLHLQQGARDKAQTALREALRIYTKRYGPRHRFTRRARDELASAER